MRVASLAGPLSVSVLELADAIAWTSVACASVVGAGPSASVLELANAIYVAERFCIACKGLEFVNAGALELDGRGAAMREEDRRQVAARRRAGRLARSTKTQLLCMHAVLERRRLTHAGMIKRARVRAVSRARTSFGFVEVVVHDKPAEDEACAETGGVRSPMRRRKPTKAFKPIGSVVDEHFVMLMREAVSRRDMGCSARRQGCPGNGSWTDVWDTVGVADSFLPRSKRGPDRAEAFHLRCFEALELLAPTWAKYIPVRQVLGTSERVEHGAFLGCGEHPSGMLGL